MLHISARGSPDGGLRFLTDDGGDAPVTDNGLRKLLAVYVEDGLVLIVLNACWTADLADALTEVVDCVIGTHGPLSDLHAIGYSRSLYLNLACGRSVGHAHRAALAALEMYGADPALLPELRTAPRVNADAVFLVAPEFRRPPRRAPIKPRGSAFLAKLRKPYR
ncbi:hypothetical protein U9R90_25935 [Streptomyces sp. E11-3]|uniref:hypothetical protein n=1 Tax=Streptomyces sp. E11-3 TaxID=3110112 RepID=UPI0039803AB7